MDLGCRFNAEEGERRQHQKMSTSFVLRCSNSRGAKRWLKKWRIRRQGNKAGNQIDCLWNTSLYIALMASIEQACHFMPHSYALHLYSDYETKWFLAWIKAIKSTDLLLVMLTVSFFFQNIGRAVHHVSKLSRRKEYHWHIAAKAFSFKIKALPIFAGLTVETLIDWQLASLYRPNIVYKKYAFPKSERPL